MSFESLEDTCVIRRRLEQKRCTEAKEQRKARIASTIIAISVFVIVVSVLLSFFHHRARGQESSILKKAAVKPLPLRGPLGITPSAEQIELGRKLFFDVRLSQSGTVSCATCHDPKKGWSDGKIVAEGAGGRLGTRRTPSIINSSYSPLSFWDARVVANETQALLPLENTAEMAEPANPAQGIVPQTSRVVVARLRLIPEYVADFAKAFPNIDPTQGSPITELNLAVALASFETTIVSFGAPIDYYLEGDENAMSPDAKIGYELVNKSYCKECHPAPFYTDHLVHNNGMEWAAKMRPSDNGRWDVVPRQMRTAEMVRAFKTPTWRDVEKRAPYSHTGYMADLDRVILHYTLGGKKFDETKDPYMDRRIVPTGWNATQRKYVKRFFVEALAGKDYPTGEGK